VTKQAVVWYQEGLIRLVPSPTASGLLRAARATIGRMADVTSWHGCLSAKSTLSGLQITALALSDEPNVSLLSAGAH
jgi:hypothetical protein